VENTGSVESTGPTAHASHTSHTPPECLAMAGEAIEAREIRELPSFLALSAEEAARLAIRLAPKRLRAGETLFRQGEAGDVFYLLVSGEIDVRLMLPNGEEHPLPAAGPGAILGEMSLLLDAPRAASAAARTDALLWSMARADFDAALLASEGWANH